MTLTEKVCANARRRVLQGETLANSDKLFSMFEPHTELIKRGKQPNPIQFGHNVLVIEDAVLLTFHIFVCCANSGTSYAAWSSCLVLAWRAASKAERQLRPLSVTW